MEGSLLWQIIVGLIGLIVAIIGWNFRMHKADHDRLKDHHNKLALAVAKEYALKTDLNAARLETTESLKRVYDKIEAVDENLDRKISDIPEKVLRLLVRHEK